MIWYVFQIPALLTFDSCIYVHSPMDIYSEG